MKNALADGAARAAELKGCSDKQGFIKPAAPCAQVTSAIFLERCEALSTAVALGTMPLHRAVDALQACAETSGLIDLIGQDAVQAIMAAAFAWRFRGG